MSDSYVEKLKKKFKVESGEDAYRAMEKELRVLPDDELERLREGYPSNIHVGREYKRRGLGKGK